MIEGKLLRSYICPHSFVPPDKSGGYAQATPNGVIRALNSPGACNKRHLTLSGKGIEKCIKNQVKAYYSYQ